MASSIAALSGSSQPRLRRTSIALLRFELPPI
jgi:hypothetical protein